jgi:hypothetical protein
VINTNRTVKIWVVSGNEYPYLKKSISHIFLVLPVQRKRQGFSFETDFSNTFAFEKNVKPDSGWKKRRSTRYLKNRRIFSGLGKRLKYHRGLRTLRSLNR